MYTSLELVVGFVEVVPFFCQSNLFSPVPFAMSVQQTHGPPVPSIASGTAQEEEQRWDSILRVTFPAVFSPQTEVGNIRSVVASGNQRVGITPDKHSSEGKLGEEITIAPPHPHPPSSDNPLDHPLPLIPTLSLPVSDPLRVYQRSMRCHRH